MPQTINLNMGEMAVGRGDTRIRTGSIGSCVVIVIYDEIAKVGGMAHAMLPKKEIRASQIIDNAPFRVDTAEAIAKYADESVVRLAAEIEKIGGERKRLRAKLVGGSKMFKILDGDDFGIGYQNIESARRQLKELGIPIENEETGGTVGRLADFNLENGLVDVSTKM